MEAPVTILCSLENCVPGEIYQLPIKIYSNRFKNINKFWLDFIYDSNVLKYQHGMFTPNESIPTNISRFYCQEEKIQNSPQPTAKMHIYFEIDNWETISLPEDSVLITLSFYYAGGTTPLVWMALEDLQASQSKYYTVGFDEGGYGYNIPLEQTRCHYIPGEITGAQE